MKLRYCGLVCALVGGLLVLAACNSNQPAALVDDSYALGSGNVVPPEEAAALRALWAAEDAVLININSLPFPATPDILMNNFQHIYKGMDPTFLDRLLHEDFLFFLHASTTALYPDLGTELDRAESMMIHKNLFSGQEGSGPDGEYAPPVDQVHFQVLEQQNPWTPTDSADPIPDAETSLFDMVAYFDRGEGHALLRVEGSMQFHVTSRDSLHEGVVQSFYQMIGQRDLAVESKVTESLSWGSVLALFR